MCNLKKGQTEHLCRTDADSQTLKNSWFPKVTVLGVGDALGLWDGNSIKLDCDDHCTTINVINSLSNKKKKRHEYFSTFIGVLKESPRLSLTGF